MTNTEKTLKEGVKLYEVGYLLLPTIADDKIQTEVDKIKSIIEGVEGIFVSENIPQSRILTYPMTKAISGKKQKFNNAYFGWIKFEVATDKIKEIKEALDKVENILRFLLIITTKELKKVRSGRFSFDKDGEQVKKEDGEDGKEKKEEVKESTENISKNKEVSETETKKEEVGEKELDETIDELVIE